MKPSIFVVEDDPDISRLVRHHLEADGFAVKVFATGNTVIPESERQRPALFILDIMVPGKDGLELCRQIRQIPALAATPVIFLTAKSGEADRILGLELGADDYIPKPFSPRELVARINVILRRTTMRGADAGKPGSSLTLGGLMIDPPQHAAQFNGEDLTLTAIEFEILKTLLARPSVVLSREQIMTAAYQMNIQVSDRTIDSHIRNIRAKLADAGCDNVIDTVHGVGFRLGRCETRA
jgi:two-component system OmpR family response regulator